MNIVYTPELTEYIRKHNKKYLAVEMIELNNTDLEITDLHIYFVNRAMREQFVKKGYSMIETELGEVLLPRFPLQISETVTFGLKSVFLFKRITCDGIKV